MNIIRQGVDDLIGSVPNVPSVTSNIPMLVDPSVAENMYNTLRRIHDSTRAKYLTIWRVLITTLFIAFIGIIMYVSRQFKLYNDAERNRKIHQVNDLDLERPNYTPPYRQFDDSTTTSRRRGTTENPYVQQIRDWST
jgi:hypothetical protein